MRTPLAARGGRTRRTTSRLSIGQRTIASLPVTAGECREGGLPWRPRPRPAQRRASMGSARGSPRSLELQDEGGSQSPWKGSAYGTAMDTSIGRTAAALRVTVIRGKTSLSDRWFEIDLRSWRWSWSALSHIGGGARRGIDVLLALRDRSRAQVCQVSRANADDRLSLWPLRGVERCDGIVEGCSGSNVRAQTSVPHPLHDLTQLVAIGLENEIDCQAVCGARP